MPEPLVAKHRRSGVPVVRVETPVFYSVDEAARALAIVYAGRPVLRGQPAVQQGLSLAAHSRVVDEPGRGVDEALVAAYREVLDRHRAKFVRHAEDESGVVRSVKWLKLPESKATHIRVDAATFFDQDEAARALALVYEEVPARVGRMTCERGLHEAARGRVLERRSVGPGDADRVAFFWDKIVVTGMFPQV